MSNSASSSSSQSPLWMSKSSVRLAFDGSVTCAAPRVRFQTSQVSMVPNASSPRSARVPRARDVVEQPFELGAGEIGVEHEAGLARDHPGVAGGAQRVAMRRRAPVLPDDGVGDRLARRAIPQHRRLALVGDADGRDVARADAGLGERFVHDARLRRPDLAGVVLDPARLREDLPELLLRDRAHGAGMVEDERARAGRALVECEDE